MVPAGSKAWFDAIKLEESTVATPWSPGAIGATVIDAGGVQIDGSRGGVFRYKGIAGGARDTVEGGNQGLLFGSDTEVTAPSAGSLAVNGVPVRAGATTAPIVRAYTAGATWTKPAGLSHIVVECQAGGGGGGGAPATASTEAAAGAGGGGGGYARKLFTATDLAAAATCAVAVGAGGTTGTGAGGTGGSSTFAGTGIGTVTAAGGGGGAVGANTTTNQQVNGGAGGFGSNADLAVSGSDGANGLVRAGVYLPVGHGGGSHFGGLSRANSNTAGAAGSAYGGGGSGAVSGPSKAATSGGAGAAGIVIVTEYYL